MRCYEAELWGEHGFEGRVRYFAPDRSAVRNDMARRGESPGEIHLDPTRYLDPNETVRGSGVRILAPHNDESRP